jgi:hypothetical protein
MCRWVCVIGSCGMACVLAMRGIGLSDRYDCGMYREVVPLVRAANKLDRPLSGILSYDSSLVVKAGVIVLV